FAKDAGSTPAASTMSACTLRFLLTRRDKDGTLGGMERNPSEGEKEKKRPLEVAKVGSVSVPIYRHKNIIPKRDALGEIIYGPPDQKGKKQALVKYESFIYTVAYYLGSQRVRQKFSNLDKARQEAERAATQIGNGEIEALKLKGHDRS